MEKLLNYSGLGKYNDLIHDELDQKANIDGYYESLGSGTAEQLVSSIFEEDSTPYNFRTSGGSIDIGDRETDMIVGGTIAWNQLVQNGNFADSNNWLGSNATFTVNNNIAEIATSNVYGRIRTTYTINFKKNHKYLINGEVKCSVSTTQTRLMVSNADTSDSIWAKSTSATDWSSVSSIFNVTETADKYVLVGTLLSASTIYARNIMLIDLTQLFGSTIADYIYSLEQATAGAGVAFFRKLFQKPYYAYDVGTLMSVQASSHDMVGFNAWDEEVRLGNYDISNGTFVPENTHIANKNPVPIVPNTQYYFNTNGYNINVCYMDANMNFIRNFNSVHDVVDTAPSNARYILFNMAAAYGTTYNNDICINLSWDGERDGEYEAYVKHSYALDSSLTLRGIPKLDASNNLYYDGDTYESDGTVTRKYGIVDLGTLNWNVYGGGYPNLFYTNIADAKPARDNSVAVDSIFLAGYKTVPTDNVGTSGYTDMTVALNNASRLYVNNPNYSDPATFKTAMNGVYLVYELATPTTETADPYTNPQIVNDFGTEEYVDYAVSQGLRDIAIPVGHQTQYMANLKAKLEMSPDSPNGAGDYIVRQTNGENEYVSLASNATIQDIIARLEALEGVQGGGDNDNTV